MSFIQEVYFWGGEDLKTKNEERIDEVITLLKQVWNLHPELRFGQLIEIMKPCGPGNSEIPRFYLPDEAMVTYLREILRQQSLL